MLAVHSPLQSAACVLALVILGASSAPAQDGGKEMEELYQSWIRAVQEPPYVVQSDLSTRLEEPSMVKLLERGRSAAVFLASKTGKLPAHLDYVLVQAIARARGQKFSSAADFLKWREEVTGEKIDPFCFDSRAEYEDWRKEHPSRGAPGITPSLGMGGDSGGQKAVTGSHGGEIDVAGPGDGESSPASTAVPSLVAPQLQSSVSPKSAPVGPLVELCTGMQALEPSSSDALHLVGALQKEDTPPSSGGLSRSYVVAALGAGLAIVAAGVWFFLRRQSRGGVP